MPTGPAKDLVFSDEEDSDPDAEILPPGQHVFDLDEMPEDEESAEELQLDSDDELDLEDDELDLDEDEMDEFGVEAESDEDEGMEEDSAFASSDEEDVEMDESSDPRTAHLRLNPTEALSDDDEDGAITTNLEDDLTNEGFSLPAVDRGGEEEDFEHGTSLREVETRMRWLVGVCMGKGEKVSKGVPGK